MSEFKKDDSFWSIDVFIECGTVYSVEKDGYGIMRDPNTNIKTSTTAKTKEDAINSMISKLEELK